MHIKHTLKILRCSRMQPEPASENINIKFDVYEKASTWQLDLSFVRTVTEIHNSFFFPLNLSNRCWILILYNILNGMDLLL